MAGSPLFKVYRNGEYVAACKYPEDAAAIVGMSGGEVRAGHRKRDVYANGWDAVTLDGPNGEHMTGEDVLNGLLLAVDALGREPIPASALAADVASVFLLMGEAGTALYNARNALRTINGMPRV